MFNKETKTFAIGLILFLTLVFCCLGWFFYKPTQTTKLSQSNERLAKLPKVMLWAWARPENLKFIDPTTTGVAFLAKTISLKASDVTIWPRLQVLEVAPKTALIAVVRIETDRYEKPTFLIEQKEKTLNAILELTKLKNIVGLQIDFDAKVSEREFYKELLINLRNKLPGHYILSITALASWAIYDNWIEGLPVDEAVPMLFRMGTGKQEVLNYLEAKKDFNSFLTRSSLGVSTGSEFPWLPSQRRVYIFPERNWSKELLNDSLKKVEIWQTK